LSPTFDFGVISPYYLLLVAHFFFFVNTAIQNLCQRAYSTFTAFAGHGGTLDYQVDPIKLDELEVLGGRKSVITTKSTNSPASSSNPSIGSPRSQSWHDDLAAQLLGDAHPSLMDYYDHLSNPSQKDYEMGKSLADVDVYVPMADLSGIALEESRMQISSSELMEFAQYQQAPQWPQPQQPLNALGFVTPEDVWREFTQRLGIDGR
jgi:hypothetical protein